MLQPMMSFVSAGVNSDNLHNLLITIVVYISLRLIKHNLQIKDIFFILVVVALDIYTKPQGFIAIPIAATSILLAVIKSRQWKMLSWIVVVGICAILLSSGSWQQYKGLFYVDNTAGISLIDYIQFSVGKLVSQNIVWYWGVFKWLGVVLPPIYWQVANRVVLLGIVGLLVYCWKIIKHKKVIADPYSILFLILATFVYSFAIFWYDWQHTKLNGYSLGIQARYFFPTIVGHMAVLLTGFVSLGWRPAIRKCLRKILVFIFIWLQLGGMYQIIRVYYPADNLAELVMLISQYKPWFAKEGYLYLWLSLYLLSLIYLVRISLFLGKSDARVVRQS
jgi:4-amino-4-deoxy-L-arabinose transferase-like glycosyltransferase